MTARGGAKAIQKSWKKLWKKTDPRVRTLKGAPLGTASSDGTLAFVCGNVDETRTCMTYEYAGTWRLVAVNEGAD